MSPLFMGTTTLAFNTRASAAALAWMRREGGREGGAERWVSFVFLLLRT